MKKKRTKNKCGFGEYFNIFKFINGFKIFKNLFLFDKILVYLINFKIFKFILLYLYIVW